MKIWNFFMFLGISNKCAQEYFHCSGVKALVNCLLVYLIDLDAGRGNHYEQH